MYRKRINGIIGLREILTADQNAISVINEINVTTDSIVDYSDDFRVYSGFTPEKEFDYDRAVFLATVGKKKKKKLTTRRLASSSISVKTTDTRINSIKSKSQFVPQEVNTVGAFLGSPPLGTKMISISETLKDRILVISTIKDKQSTNDDSFNSDNSEDDESDHYSEELFPMTDIDDWGYDSADEMASMYKAGPVISLENDNNDSNDNDCSDDDSNDDDSDNSNDDVSSHKQLSDIVSDWLSMLTSFGYL
jgi:hypothetical protein